MQESTRTKKWAVSILSQKGILRLRWRLPNSDARNVLALGLPDTLSNRQKAKLIAKQIETDIVEDTYDPTLEKYKAQARPADIQERINAQGETVIDLYERFVFSKEGSVDPRTIEKYRALGTRLTAFFRNHRADFVGIEKANLFVDYLRQFQNPSTIQDRLSTLSECWQWGKQDLNPWKLVKIDQAPKRSPQVFTKNEVQLILEGFKTDTHYSYYYPYVYFLFNTGCTPAEAAGLKWDAIDENHTYIWIGRKITRGNRQKNESLDEARYFPCNPQMQTFLRELRSSSIQEGTLVFPAPKGGYIGDNNFCKRAWNKMLSKLGIGYRKPYSTRATFTYYCLRAGVLPDVVAGITGQDVKTLYQDYKDCIFTHPQIPDIY